QTLFRLQFRVGRKHEHGPLGNRKVSFVEACELVLVVEIGLYGTARTSNIRRLDKRMNGYALHLKVNAIHGPSLVGAQTSLRLSKKHIESRDFHPSRRLDASGRRLRSYNPKIRGCRRRRSGAAPVLKRPDVPDTFLGTGSVFPII